ncbi:MAG: DinB family protein [Gemmatimonadales bacterium]
MTYAFHGIPDSLVPRASVALMQHAVDTYASETNKVGAVWSCFDDQDLSFRPHARSATVGEILRHQLLSERRFFGEFLGSNELPADRVVPAPLSIEACVTRHRELAVARLDYLASRQVEWWTTAAPFFDVTRERIWIFWRRVLHTAHHRTQLSVYLRLLDRPVPATYGPTADVSWSGADPTTSVEAARRR